MKGKNTSAGSSPYLFMTVSIIALNFLLVLFCRKNLPSELPLHISLDGSYADTMPYARLYFYPLTSLAITCIIYIIGGLVMKRFPKLDDTQGIRYRLVGISVLCLSLITLCSTCVSLTMGSVHFFMFAEPVIFLLMIAAIIIGEIRIRKRPENQA